MKTMELKVARIGNSRGVRLPADTLRRYRIGTVVLMEERVDGILLSPSASKNDKLSWEETARQMAEGNESWSDWDTTTGDGLDGIPWEDRPAAVAEKRACYRTKSAPKSRKPGDGGAT